MFSIFRKLFGSDDDRERAKAPGQRDRLAANSPSHASEPFRPGSVIHGKYEVVRKLGEGGFGVVVLAKMRPDNTLIALKIARPDLEFPTEVRQRFKKEASIWINLDNHPNILKAHFFDDMGGQMVIGMEYIKPDGAGRVTLADHFRHGIEAHQLTRWGMDICKGMSHAFSKGLKAHRDLKPANILIADYLRDLVGGIAKVSDFGLAGQVVPQSGQPRPSSVLQAGVTVAGEVSGTPTYMAPEQFRGLAHCSERSDIYSFGLILYEGVNNGRLPVQPNPRCRDGAEMWADFARQHHEIRFPVLKSPLWAVIGKCLNKSPADRFGSFAEVNDALENVLVNHFDALPLELATEENPDDLANKAGSLSHLGNHEAALESIEHALRLVPTNASYLMNKASILWRAGKLQEALEVCHASLKLDESRANTWGMLGLCLKGLGKPVEAIRAYRKALEIEPANHLAWANLGNCLTSAEQFEEAVRSLRKAVQLAPSVAAYHFNLGLALVATGRIDEARRCFNKVVELDPAMASAVAHARRRIG